MKTYITKNEEETKKLAQDLLSNISKNKIIALNGDLGAGKTTFSKGVAKALGVEKTLNSPTFVIMKIYDCKHAHINKLVHIDAYRIKSKADLENIGALEYFFRDDTIVLIEWAENIKDSLPKNIVNIDFKISENKREITVI